MGRSWKVCSNYFFLRSPICMRAEQPCSPYRRDTYRYTPLLAALLTPNIWLHQSFGKYFFALCDIVVGILLYQLLCGRNGREDSKPQPKAHTGSAVTDEKPASKHATSDRMATICASLHLLNPLVFSISTRGSSESTLAILVVCTLYFALHERWDATAIFLGLATHWKIYPIIYYASLLCVIGREATKKSYLGNSWSQRLLTYWNIAFNRRTIRFALVSGGTFILLNLCIYLMYVLSLCYIVL